MSTLTISGWPNEIIEFFVLEKQDTNWGIENVARRLAISLSLCVCVCVCVPQTDKDLDSNTHAHILKPQQPRYFSASVIPATLDCHQKYTKRKKNTRAT